MRAPRPGAAAGRRAGPGAGGRATAAWILYCRATAGVTPKVEAVGLIGGRVTSAAPPARAAAGTGRASPAMFWLPAMAAAGTDVAAARLTSGPLPNCGPWLNAPRFAGARLMVVL